MTYQGIAWGLASATFVVLLFQLSMGELPLTYLKCTFAAGMLSLFCQTICIAKRTYR
jgi:hypothetical protein